jgi:hypothetical protein
MQATGLTGSVAAVRRKLRALTAIIADGGATEHEKANAEALKVRLERQLKEAGAPAGDWTDNAFRLGRWITTTTKSTSPVAPKGGWTDNAHRLGKALRRGYKGWSSK